MIQILKKAFLPVSLDQAADQVTAMVFRQPRPYHFELLFLQRNYYDKDPFSGDICFPGGHRQRNEQCIDTAIRETFQETGLKLNQNHYLGTLDRIFKTNKGKSKVHLVQKEQLQMGVILFCLSSQDSSEISLCQKEMRSYKWVNFNEIFMQGNKEVLTKFPINRSGKLEVLFPAINIGMDRELWGLTLAVTIYFMFRINRLLQQNEVYRENIKIDNDFYKHCIEHCSKIEAIDKGASKKQMEAFQKFRANYLKQRALLNTKL